MTCPTTPSGGNVSTVHAALQVSGTGWILAVGDPADASRTGLHRLAPHDVDGLPAKLWRARERAAAVSGGDVRVMPVHGAGYGGFRLARRLEGEDPGVVVRHPASPGVVRRSRKGRTDRTGARGMVRALRAWDGGDRDAMSPVRIPTVAEEEGRRLPPRRGRLVRERLRLAGAVAGLLRLRGIPPGDPARGGYRARPGGMRTACGTGLPPGLLAEIHGALDRLEPGVAGLKAVEADRAAALRPDREAAAREARDGPVDGGAEAGTPPGAVPAAVPAHARHAAVPGRLRGIGPNGALLLGAGLSCRDLRNRRGPASPAGPGPVPWPGWCPRAPSCRRRRRRGRRTPDTGHPGGPTGPSGNPGRACDRRGAWFAASRGTVHPDGSRPPGTSHRPNGAPWSRGRHRPANRTGQEPGRAVGC